MALEEEKKKLNDESDFMEYRVKSSLTIFKLNLYSIFQCSRVPVRAKQYVDVKKSAHVYISTL